MRLKLVFAAACLALSASSHATLLKNGGAELGTLEGWTAGGVSSPGIDDGSFDEGINPRTGSFMFYGGRGSFGSLTQSVLLPNYGQSRQVRVSFWEQGLDQDIPSDQGYVSLTWRDIDGGVLGSVQTPGIDSHDGIWTNWNGLFAVPASAFTVDYTMHFVRNVGRDLDAFFDENELTMVPEPGSIAMLALGALALAGVQRRSRRPALRPLTAA
ncbi:PEP-CTERM sorting domain-containing protein [Massilia sp. YIM B02443]|uniref:PEP-CTERM sorting domain-containing protein n=1 Tax=Massilia sp. YIM B02443 TaxID=3050127 RepID=UPI0025B7300C|nr:PEP-CTERM sorting domain-containing protein [Massilia sp. YIM B02443]MDN4038571.1 PEP-CTERM sorting domain-containing protein [Massilia sp. YIM B02443]